MWCWGWFKLLQTRSLNCPVWRAASPPPPLPHLHPLSRTLFFFCLFGCLLPATSTIKYSHVVQLRLGTLPSCCPESGRMSPWASACVFSFFSFFFPKWTSERQRSPSGQFILQLQPNQSMSAVVSPTFPSPPSKEADPCCMTGRCREFYCTNTWSLERPRWSLGVTAGSEALEPVTTEQDPVGQRRLGHKSIKFGFINVPVAFFFYVVATLTFFSMLLVYFLSYFWSCCFF